MVFADLDHTAKILPSKILLKTFCIVTPATQTDTPAVSVLIAIALYRYFQTSDLDLATATAKGS